MNINNGFSIVDPRVDIPWGISETDLAASYREFQGKFESEFGQPSKTKPGDQQLPSHEWIIGAVSIYHFILDRFGPEEHMRVRWRGAELGRE